MHTWIGKILKDEYRKGTNLLDIEITPEGLKQFNPQFVQQQDDLSDLTMDQQQEFFEIQRKLRHENPP